MGLSHFQLALSTFNFIGSVLSSLSTCFIIVFSFTRARGHFRHKLILNLAVADFLNSTDNAASGLWVLISKRPLSASRACVVNGFIAQVSVQAADCAILAIAVVTVYVLTHVEILVRSPKDNSRMAVWVCICTWILPLTTGIIGLLDHLYVPVSGNWCWLTPTPVYIRYVLTHAWRFAFILTEIGLYLYLYIYMRGVMKPYTQPSTQISGTVHPMLVYPASPSSTRSGPNETLEIKKDTMSLYNSEGETEARGNILDSSQVLPVSPHSPEFLSQDPYPSLAQPVPVREGLALHSPIINVPNHPNLKEDGKPGFPQTIAHSDVYNTDVEKSMKEVPSSGSRMNKVLLLNAYPIAYIVLWLPGLINRLIEASGHSSKPFQILQGSTQFVGLANALTYGLQTFKRRP